MYLKEVAARLSTMLGMPLSKKMCKYLGHHIVLHGRDGERHREEVQKAHSRVEG